MPDTLSDEQLFAAFDSGRLPQEAFHHREHLRAAFLYLLRYPDLAEAALRFRSALRRLAEAYGVPHLLHETVTWAYLVLIQERMHGHAFASSQELLASCPELLDHRQGLLARYYDVGAITASRSARHLFLLPHRRARHYENDSQNHSQRGAGNENDSQNQFRRE